MEPEKQQSVLEVRGSRLPIAARMIVVYTLAGISFGAILGGMFYHRWPQHAAMLILYLALIIFAIQFAILSFELHKLQKVRRQLEAERQRALNEAKLHLTELYPDQPVRVAGMMQQLESELKRP